MTAMELIRGEGYWEPLTNMTAMTAMTTMVAIVLIRRGAGYWEPLLVVSCNGLGLRLLYIRI